MGVSSGRGIPPDGRGQVSDSGPKLFISYRREESAGHAGRLYDSVVARFGERNVFVDVDVPPGIDFVQRIQEAIGACRVLLVMMGPRWATLSEGEKAGARIADPDDFVRLEVETALDRPDVTVIPVLVAGAEMPDPDDLPDGLRALTRRNALELSDMRWRYDIGRLIATLEELLAGTSAVHATAVQAPTPQPAPRIPPALRLFIDGMLVAGLATLIARWADPISPGDQPTEASQIAAAILRRTVTWAVLGAALAVWLSFVRGEVRLLAGRAVLGLAVGALAGAIGGAIVALPQYLADPAPTAETIRSISIGSFAVSGGLIGALLGGLWIPRSVATGLVAGLAAGAMVRLLWNAVDFTGDAAFEDAFGIALQCLLIVGLVVAALQVLSTRSRPAIGDGSVGSEGGAAG